ncbi:hypothetical protein FNV43_RR05889 [Rhamnella rubrinervis]|uniref:Uncharacterized protein n=1 Tax=Rhamnella rubrinervis TaxID=2594499 RepID=A0A8K0MLF4_9ROSA|nr:hypothetical protein FNV43_RR05889 [Rhamnella rubrinervis]
MGPLMLLRKASDKLTSTKTITTTAPTKKKTCATEKSSNAVQVSRKVIPEGGGDISHLTSMSNLPLVLKVIKYKLGKNKDEWVDGKAFAIVTGIDVFNKGQFALQEHYTKFMQKDSNVNEDMDQYEHDISWESEMNDWPFNNYYVGDMLMRSWS